MKKINLKSILKKTFKKKKKTLPKRNSKLENKKSKKVKVKNKKGRPKLKQIGKSTLSSDILLPGNIEIIFFPLEI